MENKNSKTGGLLIQLLKLIATFAVAWLLTLTIFSAVVPVAADGALPTKYNFPITCIAIFLAFAVNMIIDYNAIQRLKNQISKTEADIISVNETSANLINKAERLADKFQQSETGLYSQFAEARKAPSKIRSGNDFKAVIESYPELKSNVHTQKLLNQLEVTENAKLNARTTYSSSVARYNTKIHSFPIVFLRKLCKWEDLKMQFGILKDDLVTDEELGL